MLHHGTTSATTTLITTILIATLIPILTIRPHQAWVTNRCPNRRRPQPRRRNRDFTGSNFMVHRRRGHPHQGHCHTYWQDLAHRRLPYSKVKSTIRCKAVGARPELLLQSHAFHHGNRHLKAQHLDRLQCFLIDLEASCIQVLILSQLPMSWQHRAEMMVCLLPRKAARLTITLRQGTQMER